VLETARTLAPGDDARAAVDRLEKTVRAARQTGLGDRLEVDLGEVRGLGYYTGLVFNIYVTGAPGPVGGGGRYDKLLSRFGDPRPAVGFSLDLDAVAPLARPSEAA
jgi:ATP phosphoribosyltransferase regulatory subunit